ncbi:MAG TPA: HAMP domain-containing sensor histidine kinase [Patescibacteria group bacterium]
MNFVQETLHYISIGYRLVIHTLFVSTTDVFEIHASGLFLRHSVRTPLTTIMLNLESDLGSKAKKTTYAERALAATRYVSQLLYPEENNTFELLSKLKQITEFMTDPQAKKYVYLISKLDKKVTLAGKAILLQEAISCLVTNGFEAYNPTADKIVVISVWLENNKLYLTIADFGNGMTWLTKKLSTTKGFSIKESNSGYGLWFVEKIIEEKFNGKVIIGSQSEVGTSIKIELPLV